MMFSPSAPSIETGQSCALELGTLSPGVATALDRWAKRSSTSVISTSPARFDRTMLRHARPDLIVIGASEAETGARQILDSLKSDARLQTVPAIIACTLAAVPGWLADGADDCISDSMPACEIAARLDAALRRSRRDLQVNPSTGLVGSDAISHAIGRRLDASAMFAACYADLDHFKEFNDRYGYAMGDDIIRTIAALLVEVVEEMAGEDGFVGHIGGDDFLFLVPLDAVSDTCETLVRRADELLPQRYSAHDRQAGYFFGKDRRGRLDRVPLMTLSIGVVSNERRRFTHAAQVSELATEMKTYAKTLPGSVWAMDRRSDSDSVNPPEEKHL